MLSVLEQNPGTSWEILLGNTSIQKSQDTPESPEKLDEKISERPSEPKAGDDLVTFKL